MFSNFKIKKFQIDFKLKISNFKLFLALITLFIFTTPVIATQMSNTRIKLNLQFKSQSSTPSAIQPEVSPTPIVQSKDVELKIEKKLYSLTLSYNPDDHRPIALGISPKTIDFGTINPTQSVTRLQNVAVQKGPAPFYNLYISEDHTPQDASGSGKFIPNTTGDKDKVTIANAGYWVSPLTYGFGYRTSLDKVDMYKSLPSLENGLPRMPLLKNYTNDEEIAVTLKMNINNNQTDTVYQNTIYYTLIPSL